MSDQRFWVVGGEFRSTQFDELLDGSARVFGPFDTHSTAERVWRDNSERHRSSCCTRFTIVQEPQRASAS